MTSREIQNGKIGLFKNGLPKFESKFWLSLGIIFGVVLVIDAVWSMVYSYQPFFPFQVGRIFRIVLGLVLAVHSIDIIHYRSKHRIVVYQKGSEEHKIVIDKKKERKSQGWLVDRIYWWYDSLVFAWGETSFKIGVLVCTSGIVIGLLAGIGMTKLVVLIAVACLGWGLEVANTAIEILCDLVHPEKSESVKIVKDAFSAVPIFTYTAYAICWLIIVAPTLYNKLFINIGW